MKINPAPAFRLLALLFLQLRATAQPAPPNAAATYLRAIYRFDYKLDSAVTTPKRDKMILRIHDGMSCFQSKVKFMQDSMFESLNNLPSQEQLNRAGPVMSKFDRSEIYYSIFKQPNIDLVSYHDGIGSKDHQYQEKTPLFHWQLMPTKKVVAGYECQQAFTAFGGRIWEAWFTRDIPVSDGPYKFYGLPGLIVQVRDTHDNYVFELLSFDGNSSPFNIFATTWAAPSPTAPLIKKAKFLQAKHNDDLTIFDRMAVSGNIIPPGMQRDYFEKLKRRNNPLERK